MLGMADPSQTSEAAFDLIAPLGALRRDESICEGSGNEAHEVMQSRGCQEGKLSGAAMMLEPILRVGEALFEVEAQRSVGGTGAAIVNGLGVGEEYDLVAGLAETVAPVDILSVHEEVGVERADSVDRSAPDQNEPAVEHLDRGSRLMIEIRHQEAAEPSGSLEGNVEGQGTGEVVPDCRETHGGAPDFVIWPKHLWSDHANRGILGKKSEHGGEAVVGKLDVGIHEADVVGRTVCDPNVVGLGESEIFGVANEFEFRESLGDYGGSAVRGSIVDDDYFIVNILAVLAQRLETLKHILLRVPDHDDHGHRGSLRLRFGKREW